MEGYIVFEYHVQVPGPTQEAFVKKQHVLDGLGYFAPLMECTESLSEDSQLPPQSWASAQSHAIL